MLPLATSPTVSGIVFDDHRLVANAGLLLPATLARHLGLRELVDHHLDLGGAPGRCQHRRQADDPGWPQPWPAAEPASTTPMCCAPGGRPAPWACTVKAPSTLGKNLPAQLPVGLTPSARLDRP